MALGMITQPNGDDAVGDQESDVSGGCKRVSTSLEGGMAFPRQKLNQVHGEGSHDL